MKKYIVILAALIISFTACKKDKPTTPDPPPPAPRLIFKFKFDSAQVRLDSHGGIATMPANHRGQNPRFNKMSAHYIEMAQDTFTAVGAGKIIYHAPEVTTGGSTAIDFSQSLFAGNGEEFYSVPLSSLTAGTYKYLRVSLAYQNYDITYKSSAIPGNHLGTGTIASFVGFNTYVTNYVIKNQSISVNANKAQGYWGFETNVFGTYYTATGQAPPGATTVVNPLFATSPIPAGSCLATGKFVNSSGVAQAFTITGTETSDIVITVSLSTNNSFEWYETGSDNYYEPSVGDSVVDMGLRGLKPILP